MSGKPLGTHLAIEPADIGIRDDLGDDGAEAQDAVHRVAVAVEVEAVAERDGERGPELGRGHRDELADLEPGEAPRAAVAPKRGIVDDRDDLLDGVREQQAVRRPVRQRVRVPGVVLAFRRRVL